MSLRILKELNILEGIWLQLNVTEAPEITTIQAYRNMQNWLFRLTHNHKWRMLLRHMFL